MEKVVGQSFPSMAPSRACGVISNDGLCSHFEAECSRCARVNRGPEMAARQALLTDLNRRRDLTGRRARISKTSSSGKSVGDVRFLLLEV